MTNENLRRTWLTQDLVMSGLLALLLITGLLGAAFTHQYVRNFVSNTQLPIFPSAAPPGAVVAAEPVPEGGTESAAPAPAGEESPAVAELERAAPPPAATESLTILLMGIDRRAGEEGPWRTDTMILLQVDPATDQMAILSMPRDLYVTLPDYGRGERLDRVNTAFFYGDSANYPGGGPALAKATIRRNFGIEVDRFIVLDFDGFRRIIDHIGGVEVDVPAPLVDREYPTEDYGTMTVRFDAGLQQMDGERALIYSRTRKSTSDFARAERQQQVIMAVRDRVLSLDILSSLTPANLARLIATLDQSVATDLTLDEVLALVPVARRIDGQNIRRALISPEMVTDYVTPEGAQVLLPRWELIRPLVEETFHGTAAAVAPANGVRIEVRNGTAVADLEMRHASDLLARGYNVTGIGEADRDDYDGTLILLYDERATETAERLRLRYGLPEEVIRPMPAAASSADLVLILGTDLN